MILSIGMIVKNEKKYLNECLQALMPILNKIDSELIIVDTGSTDETVEIAKKYTDKVYSYKWCDNFAAARNETIRYAAGEWYMFIDADEILQDSSEIIRFFSSGEYTKYNGAKYIIKSYRSTNKASYANIFSYRMYKLEESTRFIGSIHEFIPIPNNIKSLGLTVFEHYGYIFEDKKFTRAKAKRNIDLMLKEAEENPNDPRLRSHIVDSYLLIDNYDESIRHAKIGLELCEKNGQYEFYCALQSNLIFSYMKSANHLAVIEESTNYFKHEKSIIATHIDVYYFMLLSYYELKNYNKCIDCHKKYIELVVKFKSNKLNTYDLDKRSILCADDMAINNIILIAATSYIKLNDYKSSAQLLNQKSLKNYRHIKIPYVYFNLYLELMEKLNDYTDLKKLYTTANSEKNAEFLQSLEHAIEAFAIAHEAEKIKIIDTLHNSEIKNDYISYIKVKHSFIHRKDNAIQLLNQYCKGDIRLKAYHFDLLYYIIENNLPISCIYGKIADNDLKTHIETLYNNYNDFVLKLISYNYKSEAIEDNYLLFIIYSSTLDLLPEDNAENIMQLYKRYIENLERYLYFTFTGSVINDECQHYANLLPSKLLAGYYCVIAEKHLSNNDKTNYIKYLKLALNTDDTKKNTITVLLNNFQNNYTAREEKSEFEILAETVKGNIIMLIKSGNSEQAKEILNEYKLINPNDADIKNIEIQLK